MRITHYRGPIFAAIWIILSSALSAQLGTTKKEVVELYGAPRLENERWMGFEVGEYGIVVGIFEGRVEWIGYERLDGEIIPARTVERQLAANGNN
ncbi:MAG: hypothetical protein AAF191_08930 [Verrucomicrobiota bacterium]